MAHTKFRLVTRSDFDGLVCAVLLTLLRPSAIRAIAQTISFILTCHRLPAWSLITMAVPADSLHVFTT